MINRYIFEAYCGNVLLFQCECRTINHVARIRDCFYVSDEIGSDYDYWFEVYDVVHGKSIDVRELMRIWHGEQIFD